MPNDLGPVSSINAGFGANTFAVKADGTVECWALNSAATVPPNLGIVSSISAGYDYFCAVKTEGSIQCWGQMFRAKAPSQQISVTPTNQKYQVHIGLVLTLQIEEESPHIQLAPCFGRSPAG